MRTNLGQRSRRRPAAVVVATAAVAGLAAAPLAGASVYKCLGDTGLVVYQEAPCPPGRELRNFAADPPDLSVIPGGVAGGTASVEKPKKPRTIRGEKTIGKVVADASARKFVHSGMTEAEVLARIGRPDATAGGSRNRQTRWSYLPTGADPDTVTTVTFSGGAVSDVTRKVVKR